MSKTIMFISSFLFLGMNPTQVLESLNYVTGWDLGFEELMRIGERAQNLKRMYNVRLGLTKKDDILPARLKEKFTEGGAANYSPEPEKIQNSQRI